MIWLLTPLIAVCTAWLASVVGAYMLDALFRVLGSMDNEMRKATGDYL